MPGCAATFGWDRDESKVRLALVFMRIAMRARVDWDGRVGAHVFMRIAMRARLNWDGRVGAHVFMRIAWAAGWWEKSSLGKR